MPQQLQIDWQPLPPLLSHKRENSKANEAIYKAQEKRLTLNARTLWECFKEGQMLTGMDIMLGVKHKGMTEVKRMTEYRKRIQEIQKAYSDPLKYNELENGTRQWYLPKGY